MHAPSAGLPLGACGDHPRPAGELEEGETDVRSGIARLNDLRDAGEAKLGEALRPLYIDYLAEGRDS